MTQLHHSKVRCKTLAVPCIHKMPAKCFGKELILHFVNENLTIENSAQAEEVESYLEFAGHGLAENVVGLPEQQ